jgi:hypothetical protein
MPAPWRPTSAARAGSGVLNQQGRWVFLPGYRSSVGGLTFEQMVAAGHDFLLADNASLTLPDDSFDEVITNSIPPVDSWTHLGPTVQSSEIRRILKPGGRWIDNGSVRYTKP